MTHVPTWSGFLCLAVVTDVYSRKVVGLAFGGMMTAELVISALNMALLARKPESVIPSFRSGSQGGFNRSSQHWVVERRAWSAFLGRRTAPVCARAHRRGSLLPAPCAAKKRRKYVKHWTSVSCQTLTLWQAADGCNLCPVDVARLRAGVCCMLNQQGDGCRCFFAWQRGPRLP